MGAEDAERLRLIADHPDNDLSPNDHGLLLALADARFDAGITEQEYREIRFQMLESERGFGHAPDWHSVMTKLRNAFQVTP